MPLTQPPKDAAVAAQQNSNTTLAAWPDDVPEKAALVSQAGTLLAGIQAAVVPPPPVGQQPDPLLICDVAADPYNIGGISARYFYTPYLAWTPGGEWKDKNGTLCGKVPFVTSALIPYGAPAQLINIDVNPLIKPGVQPQICLRGKSQGNTAPQIRFNSREVNAMMQLQYRYDDNTTEIVNVLADVGCVSPTTTEAQLGGATTWDLSPYMGVYLRFPAPKRPTLAAVLSLSFLKIYNAGGYVEVYDGTFTRPPPPPDTFTLLGDSRVFFETACFEDAPPYIKAAMFGDPAHGLALDKYHQRNIILDETGSKVLQISFDPAVNAALTTSVLFPQYEEADEAAVEFDIRFMPDMLTGLDQGFKCFAGWSSSTKNDDAYYASIWGLKPGRCGTLLAGNGGAKAHGDDGWSLRWDAFKSPADTTHPLYGHIPIMQYVYHPLQKDYYGDPWAWDQTGWTPKVNQWVRIAHRMKCNSCTGTTFTADAEFDGYQDGKLAVRKRGFYVRTTDKPLISLPPYNVDSQLRIGRSWLNAYHGGQTLPRARCSFQIRNYRVARFA